MNLLIVDDHPLVCKGIRNILSSEGSFANIMEAGDISTALKLMSEHEFSLALVDMRLKRESGIDFVKTAKRSYPDCKYMIISSSSLPQDFDEAMGADVDGYILKDALPEDIVYAVKSVLRGKKYFDPLFTEKIYSLSRQPAPENPLDQLSLREKEILECLKNGLSNREIADKLYISLNTVKKHVSSILEKLNVNDRLQAVLYANKLFEKDRQDR